MLFDSIFFNLKTIIIKKRIATLVASLAFLAAAGLSFASFQKADSGISGLLISNIQALAQDEPDEPVKQSLFHHYIMHNHSGWGKFCRTYVRMQRQSRQHF